ncbi:MAG: C1 family peptidase [Fluviicola sp.]|nr:C1 family peptidase [Fluviicola sp.]
MKQLFYGLMLLVSGTAISQGLIPLPEEQYEKLPAPPMLAGASTRSSLPVSYVIPESYLPTPGNQGGQPSCTAWATGYALMSFYQARVNGWSLSEDNTTFSPSYVYQNIRQGDCTSGTYITSALDFMKTSGNVPLSYFPYDENSCTKPSADLKQDAINYTIKNWFRVEDINNLTEIKTYLSQGIPIAIASYTDKAFQNFENKSDNDVFTWKSGNYKGGYHAMLAVGYDDLKGAVKVMNSWGTNWGTRGFVWIDYASFRTMVNEGYVVEKNYSMENEEPIPDPVPDPDPYFDADNSIANYAEEGLEMYGYSEEIREGRNFYSFGFVVSGELLPLVTSVVYFYNHPSFENQYVTISEGPYFQSSYEGYGCIEDMEAEVYFEDGSSLLYAFDGCELIAQTLEFEEEYDYEYDITEVEIEPVVTAYSTDKADKYKFRIELRGIDQISDRITKVVYDRNHHSFKQPQMTSVDAEHDFRAEYTGWGCLRNVIVTIYFDDGSEQSFELDMCAYLGW